MQYGEAGTGAVITLGDPGSGQHMLGSNMVTQALQTCLNDIVSRPHLEFELQGVHFSCTHEQRLYTPHNCLLRP